MTKRKRDNQIDYDAWANTPNEVKPIIKEFIERMSVIENEVQVLNEQKRELMDEYKEKIDTKTLKLAIKMVDIEKKVAHKDTFDLFLEILQEERFNK